MASNGRFVPFVSYDPRKDGSYLDQVKNAIIHDGFIGVKLYPPTGFRPLNNERYQGEAGKKVDKNLRDLYSWCNTHGVPIMAHSNNSMGFSKETDYFSHPLFWEPVLKEFPNMPVNLGHFGGMEDLAKNGVGDWPWFTVELMTQYDNLYADLSNFNDMAGGALRFSSLRRTRFKYFDNLKYMIDLFEKRAELTSSSLAASPKKRLMYGTDWHMLSSEVGNEKYFQNFKNHYGHMYCGTGDSSGELKYFMGENASNFLGLNTSVFNGAGGYHVEWLANFYKGNSINPGWVELLSPDSLFRKKMQS